MKFVTVRSFILLLIFHFAYSQIDELRRQRNPFEFYQIGPESPSKEHHHLYVAQPLSAVPPIGTSDFVRYFARQTSGENFKNLRYGEENNEITLRRVAVIDNDDERDPYASHRNFVTAGNNKYYSVQTPSSDQPQAPIVGFYHSSYQNKGRGGKLYLGNRPFYF